MHIHLKQFITINIQTYLTTFWMRRGWLACLLWPISLVYQFIVWGRRRLYAWGWKTATRVSVPVIVVGNIFIGGTGKTPLTLYLIDALRALGWTPGVVSRGYGTQLFQGVREVTPHMSAALAGDEPLLIAQRGHCPVMISRQRVAAAKALVVAYPEVNVILSDDGLQHYALQRTVEIVVFDQRGIGNGWCLPAGPLRESRHRTGDIVVINTPYASIVRKRGEYLMHLRATHIERLNNRAITLDFLTLRRHAPLSIVAAAGIGHPERFFNMLRSLGLTITPLPLPDHMPFSETIFYASKKCQEAEMILITEKDAVKCRTLTALRDNPRLWVVPVTAEIDARLVTDIVERIRE